MMLETGSHWTGSIATLSDQCAAALVFSKYRVPQPHQDPHFGHSCPLSASQSSELSARFPDESQDPWRSREYFSQPPWMPTCVGSAELEVSSRKARQLLSGTQIARGRALGPGSPLRCGRDDNRILHANPTRSPGLDPGPPLEAYGLCSTRSRIKSGTTEINAPHLEQKYPNPE